ncbi:unnamed protein product, partial [Polarella glacialis]
ALKKQRVAEPPPISKPAHSAQFADLWAEAQAAESLHHKDQNQAVATSTASCGTNSTRRVVVEKGLAPRSTASRPPRGSSFQSPGGGTNASSFSSSSSYKES